ncbi:hypothetical protein THOG05_320007 [Vibrio rotiferianus]|nr:hypothetical protein THOG05_320007 [Vibrio rotiferianus]
MDLLYKVLQSELNQFFCLLGMHLSQHSLKTELNPNLNALDALKLSFQKHVSNGLAQQRKCRYFVATTLPSYLKILFNFHYLLLSQIQVWHFFLGRSYLYILVNYNPLIYNKRKVTAYFGIFRTAISAVCQVSVRNHRNTQKQSFV